MYGPTEITHTQMCQLCKPGYENLLSILRDALSFVFKFLMDERKSVRMLNDAFPG